ncbi:Uncharacterised protein [Klebsiella pneumoniae]|uniref:Uncharacterized protein n=1 Tax=Klebsiella quasipneumoniae TaxID=1463165 RepID=A0A2A5ME70_9ENTR|nr:hypothetical protein AM364_11625 [Klebsiella pneumoniae]ATN97217.1 hypothetical protein AN676_0300175 [Klebsiella pneumoniae subsp. pneumoniae]EJK91503.1 hypothetical protein UUU_15280 [Klebsiella pneumoniae subsp. pneumoniae DSM 30104 = JCM 1662 = NBRC 14940]PCM59219.1 hypothetical protein CP911_23220 [Klebsiella quasipneumoniae]ATO02197.1 hypothetical protein AN676_0327470 [Klebsiella pneumoniae subsp. pneumoniae]
MRLFKKLLMNRSPNILISHNFPPHTPSLNYSAQHFTAFNEFGHFYHKKHMISMKTLMNQG